MTRTSRAAGLALLLLGAAAYRQEPPVPPAVLRLLGCIECNSGELAAVTALGDSAVPALRRFLLAGPPTEAVDRMRRSLVALGRDPALPPTGSRMLERAVAKQLADYIGHYRLRAALGLAAIGTPEARAALCAGRAADRGRGGLGTVLDSALMAAGRVTCP